MRAGGKGSSRSIDHVHEATETYNYGQHLKKQHRHSLPAASHGSAARRETVKRMPRPSREQREENEQNEKANEKENEKKNTEGKTGDGKSSC